MTSIARQFFAVAGFVFFMSPSGAAGLGEIRARSALGERFDAVVSVFAAEDENLSEECFKIVIPRDEADVRVLRHARIAFRKNERGGEVRITGSEIEHEPLLKVALNLRCPEENVRGITREYSVLLDLPASRVVVAPEPAMVSSEKVPASRVTTSVAPEKARSSTNISAPQAIQPPKKNSRTDKPGKVPRINKTAHASSPAPAGTPGEFRLQLSSAQLDMGHVNLNLSEEEKLKLRERMLLIESDDQTAQLLQLKDRINRLEKQLVVMSSLAQASEAAAVHTPSRIASPVAVANNEGGSVWLWSSLALLSLSAAGWFFWRRKADHNMEQNPYLFDSQSPDTLISPVDPEPEDAQEQPSLVPPVRSADEWGSDDMDVVSPNTVAEEAQLLLDHGLVRQAIDLLLHEVKVRPTALALWMKLFDAYRMVEDQKGFQTQALAFQQCFVSESLWQQVQAIGRELDPLNPLYIVAEAQSQDELAIPHNPQPSGNDDFDILEIMQRHVPLEKGNSEGFLQQEADLPLEFHLPEMPATPFRGEWPDAPFIQEGEHLFGFDAPTLELPLEDALDSPSPLREEEFVSADPVLQTIARMYFAGQRDEACQQLEELLYKGSFDQRMAAARWLDRLLPVKGTGNRLKK